MSDMPDLSSLFGMLNDKGIDINNIMQNFSNNNASNNSQSNNTSDNSNNFSSSNTNNNSFDASNISDFINNYSNKNSNTSNQQADNNFQMPDMETMMKIMKIMNSMNSNAPNPSANLLYSLKPFLRDSKKEKVDQYVKFLKISSILSEMNKSGGDNK